MFASDLHHITRLWHRSKSGAVVLEVEADAVLVLAGRRGLLHGRMHRACYIISAHRIVCWTTEKYCLHHRAAQRCGLHGPAPSAGVMQALSRRMHSSVTDFDSALTTCARALTISREVNPAVSLQRGSGSLHIVACVCCRRCAGAKKYTALTPLRQQHKHDQSLPFGRPDYMLQRHDRH